MFLLVVVTQPAPFCVFRISANCSKETLSSNKSELDFTLKTINQKKNKSGRFSVPAEERASERKAWIYSALNKSAVSVTWILCSFSANFTPLCSVCRLGSFFLCSFNSVLIPLYGPALSTRSDIYIVPLKNACLDYIQRLFTHIIF